ncbi:MAG: hypothetical protein CNCCGFBP_01884 [Fimbriimonadaceae bacterium]|nr:hypothetical protein [Fimbriimonadaceae bacterium]
MRPAAVDEPSLERIGTCDVPAHNPQRLGESSELNVHPPVQPIVRGRSRAFLAEYARSVSVVDHENRVIALAQLDNLRERCDVSVHAEHAVGDHELLLKPPLQSPAQAVFEGVHVLVRIDPSVALAILRAGKPDSVDDACVVQLVRNDHVLVRGDGRNAP